MIYNYVLNVSTYDGYKGMYTCVCIIYDCVFNVSTYKGIHICMYMCVCDI